MRQTLAIILCWLLAAPLPAATFTSVQSGSWTAGSTWDQSGAVPGDGDVVRVANGHTITISTGANVIVGTSPADDSGTAAVACSSSTGTGILAIQSGAHLTFRGPVAQCNSVWTIAGGAHITHDSSLATTPASANYSWRINGASGQVSAGLTAVGSQGSRITFDVAAGSGNAGGFRPYIDAGTDGNLTLQFADIDHWGTASGYAIRLYPFTGSTSIVRGLILRNFTVTNGGEVYIANATGSCTVDVEDGVLDGALTARALSIGQYSPLNSAIATNGVRRLRNLYVGAGSLSLYGHATNQWDYGLELSNLYLRGATGANQAPMLRSGNISTGASGGADLILLDNRIQSSSDSGSIVGGNVSRLVLLRNYQPNAHFVYTVPVDTTVDGWLAWDSVSDSSSAGDVFMFVTTGTSTHSIAIRNGVMLRQPDGNANGTTVNYNGATACSGANCPAIAVENNTFMTADVGSTGAVGVTQESNNGYAGIYSSVKDNLVHQQTNTTGWITKWTSSLAVVGNEFTTADYNWSWNLTGARYFTETANAEYSTAPGAHDQSGDPLFVDQARTPLSYAQRWDPSVSTMDDVAARFKACYQYGADGTTACDPRFSLADMYAWIRAGWRTRNNATWSASSSGSHVGGVAPDRTFGRAAAGGF